MSSRLKVSTKASVAPLLSRLVTGVEHGVTCSCAANRRRSLTVQGQPLSDSHSAGLGARMAPTRLDPCASRLIRLQPDTPSVATTTQ